MDFLTAGISLFSGLSSFFGNRDKEHEQNLLMEHQYEYQLQDYGNQLAYHHQLLNFANEQRQYANLLNSIKWANYNLALADRQAQIDYLNRANQLMKQAAITQFNADKETANIAINSAKEQTQAIIQDALRADRANKETIGRQGDVAIGKVVNKAKTGLAQGASKEALVWDAYRKRYEALQRLDDKTKATLVGALDAYGKIVNKEMTKVGQSYRNTVATLLVEPRPVPHIPTPLPAFTGVRPVPPVPPKPVYGGVSTGSSWFGNAVSSLGTAVQTYEVLSNSSLFSGLFGSTSTSPTMVGSLNSTDMF